MNVLTKANKERIQYSPESNSLTLSHAALTWEGDYQEASPRVPAGPLVPLSLRREMRKRVPETLAYPRPSLRGRRGCVSHAPVGWRRPSGSASTHCTDWISWPFPFTWGLVTSGLGCCNFWWCNPAMSLVTRSLPRQDRKEFNVWREKQKHL